MDGAAALGGEGGGGGFAFLGRTIGGGEGEGGGRRRAEPKKARGKDQGAWPCDSVRRWRWQRTASGGAFCFPFRGCDSFATRES
jgi:hypothetical protein